ncbi:AAA family ATPase [Paenibacillus bovis]|uniref:Magnesium chelatase n=1 Tax=Paenibacillus bovis TaxID=1616788 RepID=A0A172ZET9_9BACL|nr:MoxR family ATPase [Paenibacillus bovis]ANF96155.1 magnesium chelatase [Paenibacillus bovis]
MIPVNEVQNIARQLQTEIGRKIVGKQHEIQLLLTALFASGHVLMEDVPGTGKTMLAKTLAAAMQCRFQRVQFTPDLLPSDLTGGNFYNQKESEFIFRPGPLFAHIVLADEINRATPRTQSSLLECMEEKQISIDGTSMKLEDPFMVIATQNPVDNQGTFPLPEAQMDRFMLKLSLGYPSSAEGVEILRRSLEMPDAPPVSSQLDEKNEVPSYQKPADSESASAIYTEAVRSADYAVTRDQIIQTRQICRQIQVHPDLLEYMVRIAEATRQHADTALGASPRATQALLRASQAYAAIQGRNYVLPDDIRTLAAPVLAHRLIFRSRHQNGVVQAQQLIQSILDTEPVPTEAGIEGSVK